MDFSIPPHLQELLLRVRRFVDDELIPLETGAPWLGPFADLVPRLDALREKARGEGLWLPQIPREHGGMGLSLSEFALVGEELGRSPWGHYVLNCQAPDAGNMEVLLHFATPEQQERFLHPLLRGEVRSCFGMTEPERPGSNPVWLGTRAAADGEGFVLDGHKWFTSGADGAAFAIVMAATDPDAPPHQRASLLLVPTETPGFRLVRNVPVMGHAGDGWASHGEVRFEGCRLPPESLLGEAGGGFAMAQARLGPGRIHHCMRWLGICERSFDLLCRRAVSRRMGPSDTLADRQVIAHSVAELRAEIDAARLAVLHAAWRMDREGARAAREAIALIKFQLAGLLGRVVDRAIQVHGALGVTDDTVLSFFYRFERGARIYDGADEVHKDAAARSILRRYREEAAREI